MRIDNNRRAARDQHDSAIELLDKTGKFVAMGRLVDFSMSGASFRAELVLAVGAQVRARIRLLEKGTLDISALVVWSRKDAGTNFYGIKFDSMETVYPTGELKRPFG